MAYSELGGSTDSIKREPSAASTPHYHDLLHHQLSAENTRNTDHDSADESGESPLDFSIKRKAKTYDEVSGSESLSSPASSLNDTGGHLDDKKNDNDPGELNHRLSRDSPPPPPPLLSHMRSNSIDNKFLANESIHKRRSPVGERIGHPRLGVSRSGSPSPGLHNNLNELQMGLSNANMLASAFPTMAALMDPRRLSATSKYNTYPTDAMALSVSNAGLPSYLSSFANFENSISNVGISLSSDEIFSIYKQQLMTLRERDKYLETLRMSQEHSPTRTSTVTSSPSMPTFPPSLSSTALHLGNRNNGINSSVIRDHPQPPASPSSRSQSPLNTNNSDSNGTSHTPLSITASGRRRPRTLPDEQKDDAYWERRRKNNEAAKRSRDARRAKEEQIAVRAALLEQENLKLRVEVAALKTETAKLRCMLYNS